LGELDRAARHFNATPAQIAIAWLLAQPGITAPIVSVTSPAQLTEIFGATTMTLDARTLMRLDLVSA
jgi:aryl-alcohol dehydrogenase-like predicted oxidoreductase